MAVKGSKQVPLVGIDDKREITALLAINMAGHMLPPQIIYSGTTEKCHPSTVFPPEWDIYHTKNHWSNSDSMDRYLDKIIFPYIAKKRQELGLSSDQKAICIFDVFAAQRTQDFLKKLRDHNVLPIFVPASCTSELQPLDLTVNDQLKVLLKSKFSLWYSEQVMQGLHTSKGGPLGKVSLNLSVLKPLNSQWLIDSIGTLSSRASVIRSGFRKAGILVDNTSTAPYEADTEPPSSGNEQASDASSIVSNTTVPETSFSMIVVTSKPCAEVYEVMEDMLKKLD